MNQPVRRGIGRLDHVHLRVPDRAAAAAWYAEHFGFEPVEEYRFWSDGVDGGPLQISADGGETMLALFELRAGQPAMPQSVAFSVDAEVFISFARSLPGDLRGPEGSLLQAADLIDFDLCVAFDIADPWGNSFELNCYDHQRVRSALIEPDGIAPHRKWPDDLHRRYREGG